MTWKDEHFGKRPADYSSSYEYRRNHQWKCYPNEDDGYTKVISYLTPKLRGQQYDVRGVVFEPPESHFTVMYDLTKAMSQVMDKIFTKKLTKGRRITMRKEFLDMPEYDTYTWVALLDYLRQCKREGSKSCLLSRKEVAILQPVLTKKQERDKRLNKQMINY